MGANIDWKKILSELVALAVPIILAWIIEWLKGATEKDAVAMATKVGRAYKAFKSA